MEQIRVLLTQFTGYEIYGLIYCILVVCSLGFPFNSDITIITAATLSSMGQVDLTYLFPTAFLGILTGDSINFFTARNYGLRLLQKRPFRWFISKDKVVSAREKFKKFGPKFVFMIRFIPFIRAPLIFTSGTLHVQPKHFYFFNIASTALYLTLMIRCSHELGEWLKHFLSQGVGT